jgi:hypothetical protein
VIREIQTSITTRSSHVYCCRSGVCHRSRAANAESFNVNQSRAGESNLHRVHIRRRRLVSGIQFIYHFAFRSTNQRLLEVGQFPTTVDV